MNASLRRLRPRLLASTACMAALCIAACTGDGGIDDDDGGTGGDDERTATFATYNAGLAVGFVPYAEDRASITTEAIADLDADVLCVQEVWREQDVAALASAASERFPNQIFLDPQPPENTGGEPACAPDDAQPLEMCARANCGEVANDELVACVFEFCEPEFNGASEECKGCLGAQVGNSLDDILEACGSGPGGGYAYDNAFGIGILTHGEILEQATVVLDATYTRRAVQYARVALPAATVDVFCTHLTAVFADIPYPRDEGSWIGEQATQIETMRAFVDDHAGAEGGVVMMGDFNTGPALDGILSEVPENYDVLIEGFENPYLEQPSPACTFCAANPLVGGADDDDSVIIDHVLTRDITGEVVSASRILDEPLELQTADGTVTSAYSDHYGVALTVEFAAR